MFQSFISYLQFGNRFCGIEHTLKDNQNVLYVTILKKTKKEIDLEESFSINTIKEVANKLPKHQHATLVINNEQVLTKSVKEQQTNDLKLINTAFPNINVSDFYYEIIKQNNLNFISICRKDYINKLLDDYNNAGLHIVSFSLGNTIISGSFKYAETTKLKTSNALISCHNNLIESINFSENIEKTPFNINGLQTNNLYFLSLSTSLCFILRNYSLANNFFNKKNILVKTFQQFRFLNLFLKFGLVFILVSLLINFIFFNFYFNKVNALNETSKLNQSTKTRIIELGNIVNTSKKMTDDILQTNSSKSSFYTNSIIKTLPESILLSEINYQPLIKNIKANKAIELNQNTIIVSGKSNNSDSYSKWIILLETIDWIGGVSVESYSDLKNGKSAFSIKIEIKS